MLVRCPFLLPLDAQHAKVLVACLACKEAATQMEDQHAADILAAEA